MPNVLDSRGFKFRYSSGIAPLITGTEYADLIKNYKATGQFPHILKLGGLAIDTSRNRNKWRVPLDDLQAIADQLKGAPLMKDHDIDHVDSIIGKVEESWVEADKDDPTAGKVLWAGETSDESLIQKILLGYVRFNSIQIAVPNAYCDNCMTANGKSEEQAAIENLDLPCPRCGSLDMLIRHPMVLGQSMVAIPAYEKAEVTPHGFKASLDLQLQKRFERAAVPKVAQPPQPDLLPMLVAAYSAVTEVAFAVVEMQLRMASMAMEGQDEGESDQNTCSECGGPLMELGSLGSRTHYRCRNCGMDFSSGSKDEAKGGSLEDFPLVQKGKKEGYEEAGGKTIADLQDRTDLVLITDSQDVDWIKGMFPQAADYDSFFAQIGDGEVTELWGFSGSVAYLSKSVDPIDIELPQPKGEAKGKACEFCGEPATQTDEDGCRVCDYHYGQSIRDMPDVFGN